MKSFSSKAGQLSGFTLIELMIVISISAILLAIGIPSFRYVTSANRASSEINGLLGDMQFARAESIREGQTVSVCATINQATCTGAGTSWTGGWIVFSDLNGDGKKDPGEDILKLQKPLSNLDTLQTDQALTKNAVIFSREGFAMGLANPLTFTLHDATSNAQYTRCLSLTIVGALSTQIGGALTAENKAC